MSRNTVQVVNPVARVQMQEPKAPSPRPHDLRGKVIGLLDNRKPNADAFMDRIEERLREEQYGVTEVVRRRKLTISNEPTQRGIIAELSERCDFVIHGIGD